MDRLSRFVWVLLFTHALVNLEGREINLLTYNDTLKGSNNEGRKWWDIDHYTLRISLDIKLRDIAGEVTIRYKNIGQGDWMMIDLQEPLLITGVFDGSGNVPFRKEADYWSVQKESGAIGTIDSVTIKYAGKPHIAKNPPWDGGIDWSEDELGRPFISTACQGIGSSIWWPCKDLQLDEPDAGADMYFTMDQSLVVASNGRLIGVKQNSDNQKTWHWRVVNPINIYNIALNAGHYVHLADTMMGEKGALTYEFYVLDYNREKGQTYMGEIKSMLECFESKLGPYPFYEDGYKMIETSHLGMEHQSGIAYGNKFMRGYLGDDRSDSGYGLHWDFILIHESGHEWFGNSITAVDINDNWIHEGFTTYTETIYTECLDGKEAAAQYVIGQRALIDNEKPLINDYHVHFRPPGDIYDKGANLVHLIRTIMDDDDKFYAMLREMNRKFYHSVVSSAEIEQFINEFSGYNFDKIFDQYLRSRDIPQLIYQYQNGKVSYHWENVVPGFKMPVRLQLESGETRLIEVKSKRKKIRLNSKPAGWDQNIYSTFKMN